jgi:biotin carboxyl carrier protein
MSVYCVTIGQREYQVQIAEGLPQLNGEAVSAHLISINGNGMHQLNRGNQSLEVFLSALPNGLYEAYMGGRRILARVDLAHRCQRRDVIAQGIGNLLAPMPGLIVEVLIQEGETVQAGQVIVVEESMKMQMQLRAPCTGRVEKIALRTGVQVEKGTLLVKIAEA